MGAGVKTCLAVNRPGALAGRHDRGGVLAGGVYETRGRGVVRHEWVTRGGHDGQGLRGSLCAGDGVGGGGRLYGRREHGTDQVEASVGRLVGRRRERTAHRGLVVSDEGHPVEGLPGQDTEVGQRDRDEAGGLRRIVHHQFLD